MKKNDFINFTNIFVDVYNKIYQEFMSNVKYSALVKSLRRQMSVHLKMDNNHINLHKLLLKEGFFNIDKYQWENGITRIFTGKFIWDPLNMFEIVYESFKRESCFYNVVNALSDQKSINVFLDWLEFAYILFVLGDTFRLSSDIFSKLLLLFPENIIFKNLVNHQQFMKDLPSRLAKTSYENILQFQSTNYGKIYVSSVNLPDLMIEIEHRLYYYEPYVAIEKGDIVIEGGAYDGKSSIIFAKDGAKQVYSFEPYKPIFEICSTVLYLNNLNNVNCINAALGQNISKAGFNIDSLRLEGVDANIGNNTSVDVLSIDAFVEKNKLEKIDFIKLDVEGEEINVINGALKTLHTYHPKLAIAVYHNALDICKIVNTLQKLGYKKFFLKHLETGIGGLTLFSI